MEFLSGTSFGMIGLYATAVAIITEVLKVLLPKSFPTKILTTLVSFVVVVGYTIVWGELTLGSIVMAIFGAFVVAFISMFGFDQFKETIMRFKNTDSGGGES